MVPVYRNIPMMDQSDQTPLMTLSEENDKVLLTPLVTTTKIAP